MKGKIAQKENQRKKVHQKIIEVGYANGLNQAIIKFDEIFPEVPYLNYINEVYDMAGQQNNQKYIHLIYKNSNIKAGLIAYKLTDKAFFEYENSIKGEYTKKFVQILLYFEEKLDMYLNKIDIIQDLIENLKILNSKEEVVNIISIMINSFDLNRLSPLLRDDYGEKLYCNKEIFSELGLNLIREHHNSKKPIFYALLVKNLKKITKTLIFLFPGLEILAKRLPKELKKSFLQFYLMQIFSYLVKILKKV